MRDPQLWKYDDHRARAEKLRANGERLSIHFDGTMYVHGGMIYASVKVGDQAIWLVIDGNWHLSYDIDLTIPVKTWRRRRA